jgi:N-acetyl-gamma-glutamyl-phosphate reductase
MIRAGILGAGGYTGVELTRLLIGHPEVEVTALSSRSGAGRDYDELFNSFLEQTDLVCEEGSLGDFARRCDVIFSALPHGILEQEAGELPEGTAVIDLSADFRLRDPELYRRWYGREHGSPRLLQRAVYGLPELAGEQLCNANLIANPGCYPTCSILTVAPLFSAGIAASAPLIVDAKSGISGAGRGINRDFHFPECNESIKAYQPGTHRHTPEIEQALSESAGETVTLQFTPHLVPMNRGILATCYAVPRGNPPAAEVLRESYRRFYRDCPFVRLLPEERLPETRWVRGSNYIDIQVTLDERSGLIVAVGAIDNLLKGAAGQAVQNMNIRFGLAEKSGLEQIPLFP